MAKDETHLISSPDNMKEVSDVLVQSKTLFKVKKISGNLHVFVESNPASTEYANIQSRLEKIAYRCAGCDICEKPRPVKKKERFVIYKPLILLPSQTPNSPEVRQLAQKLLETHPDCTHVAINAPILADRIRRPKVIPVIGDLGEFDPSPEPTGDSYEKAFWATSIQNGIFQTWAPQYTMFSRGNITEKRRVLVDLKGQSEIVNSTVIDLYSGIGYFTLPYALNNPRVVYCWEINPWSIEGLVRSAKANGLNIRIIKKDETYSPRSDDKIVVFAEDNQNALSRLSTLQLHDLSHINMGLLPDARDAIPVALSICQTAVNNRNKPKIIHLHENVRKEHLDNWVTEMSNQLGENIHLELIKQFSPGVFHVCGDFVYESR